MVQVRYAFQYTHTIPRDICLTLYSLGSLLDVLYSCPINLCYSAALSGNLRVLKIGITRLTVGLVL